MNRLALVTGAAGFIGRHVCQILHGQGYRVVGIGYGDWPAEERRVWGVDAWRNQKISIEVLESMTKAEGEPEILIHCAGGSSVGISLEHPRRDFEQTVVTTADVLEFARRREGRLTVVYPSSAAVYGVVDGRPISENAPLLPASPYGVHKRMAEELCQVYAMNWKVPLAIVRLFSVYGPGLRKQLLWDACIKAQAGNFSFSGSGDEVRDWIHVSDAAVLLVLAAEKATPVCPVVNGGTGAGLTVKDVLCCLGRLWTPALTPNFSGKVRHGDPPCYVADVSSMHTWGCRPEADIGNALADYIRWFKSERGV